MTFHVEGISVRFGGLHAVDDVSFKAEPGKVLGLIGPNGAGKSTLINALTGFVRVSAGRAGLGDDRSGPWPVRKAVERGLTRTFQTPRVFKALSVRDNLITGHMRCRCGDTAHALAHVERFALEQWLDTPGTDLPFGVLRRLSVALALAHRPAVLFLDEPAVGLTRGEVEALGDVIQSVAADGTAIVLVEHNMRFVMEQADEVLVLNRGQVLFRGSPDACQRDERVIDVYLGREAR